MEGVTVKKVIIINGVGRSGKDEFVKMCHKYCPYTVNVSSVENVKLIAQRMGWDNDKSEKGRKFLSDLKYLWDDYNGEATGRTFRRVMGYTQFMDDGGLDYLIFVHIREPEKIEEFKQMLSDEDVNAGTMLVKNSNVPEIKSNISDGSVENYSYDFVIDNSGTLEQLEELAKEFVRKCKEDVDA